jgi:cell division protein ZapA
MIADELAETANRVRALEQEVAALKESHSDAAASANSTHAALLNAVALAAERIKAVAKRLNQIGPGSGVALG